MRVLITGGAGFIGSYLAEELLKRGDVVRSVDDVSTGNLINVKHLQEFPNFTLFKGSVLDKDLMEELINESDVIYHLAAAVGVKHIMSPGKISPDYQKTIWDGSFYSKIKVTN